MTIGIFLWADRTHHLKMALLFKVLSSATFVIVSSRAPLPVHIGQVFGLMGDIVLGARYLIKGSKKMYVLAGTILFGLGHLCFSFFSISCGAVLWTSLAFVISFDILLMPLLWKHLSHHSKGRIYQGLIYINIVIIMTSVTISMYIHTRQFPVYTMGAIAFLFADGLTVYNNFAPKRDHRMRVINLISYYLAQMLIALF